MQILLDSSPLAGPAAGRGIGRYVTELRAALAALGDLQELSMAPCSGRAGELLQLPRRALALRRGRYDLLHTPTAYQATLRPRGAWVCSILDVIPLDLEVYRRSGLKARMMHSLAARADVVLTLSDHAAGRIEELLGVSRNRIVVAPLPVARGLSIDARCARLPHGLIPGSFVLALADLETPDPRKRTLWYGELARRLPVPLVLVGAGTKDAMEGVVGMGRVSDAEWRSLLSGCGVFVMTSAYEGQGLPPLEAMACGAPVVCMDNTALTELVQGAGLLVPEGPSAVPRLEEACMAVLADEERRSRLVAAGLARSSEFSRRRFAAGVRTASELALALHG